MSVDVVVVSYNSAEQLRGCVEPLCGIAGVSVVVVDNASQDRSLETIADLPLQSLALPSNGGFAHGCNAGWRNGSSRYVLFLNPDARIDVASIDRLVAVLESSERTGIVAPRIVDEDGGLHHSLRRFPRLRSTYAQALFLHKLAPTATWADEIVRSAASYEEPGTHEWASGACLLVRRELLEQLGGWDEGFFLYCEDIDLCRRAKLAGFDVRYEPTAVAVHAGGASAPRSSTLPYLAASRVRYAQLHRARPAALAERLGIVLEALTRLIVGRGGASARAGHARSMRTALLSRSNAGAA